MSRMHLPDMGSCVTLFYWQNELSGKFISLFRRLGRKKKEPLSLKDHDHAKHSTSEILFGPRSYQALSVGVSAIQHCSVSFSPTTLESA